MDLPPPPPGPLPFRDGPAAVAGLDAHSAARLIGASGDIALLLDRSGVIRDMAVGSSDLDHGMVAGWIDQPLIDTVADDSRAKVEELLREAAEASPPRWRQVNHRAADGYLPVRYIALEAGADGRMLAIGREMRAAAQMQQRLLAAQQSMERDHQQLREAEQRYRLLFQRSGEAVLVVDAGTRRVVEANPVAEALLVGRGGDLGGRAFADLFADHSRDDAVAMLGAAAGGGHPPSAILEGRSGVPVRVEASLFRNQRARYLLVRAAPLAARTEDGSAQARILGALDQLPDALVVADSTQRIQWANQAFLDLTQGGTRAEMAGRPLDRYVGRPGIDLPLLRRELADHGAVRNFATILRDSFGDEVEVEATAVSLDDRQMRGLAISLRTGVRLGWQEPPADGAPRSVERLTELVGRVPMREIVRESTDVIERLCIEAALSLSRDNRASAAEMLGLSRQSLYSKLRRHGLGNLDE